MHVHGGMIFFQCQTCAAWYLMSVECEQLHNEADHVQVRGGTRSNRRLERRWEGEPDAIWKH